MLMILSVISCLGIVSFAVSELQYVAPSEQTNYEFCRIVAHRGLSSIAPENTLAAFELAGKMRYNAIEFDIYPTTDDKWVIMHDETVDRMTNKTGKITEMSYAQTQNCIIDAGNRIKEYSGQKIPTLEQALEVCEKYNATPFIEIKGGTAADINRLSLLISKYENYKNFVFISFAKEHILQLKNLLPEITVLWLKNMPKAEDITYCLENNIDGIDFNYKNTSAELIKKIAASNLITAAYTCDSVEDFCQLCSLKVNYITTNSIVGRENTCTHICHSNNPFLKFIWKIVMIFIELNGENYCSCGVAHH